jgi:hypothetical protein
LQASWINGSPYHQAPALNLLSETCLKTKHGECTSHNTDINFMAGQMVAGFWERPGTMAEQRMAGFRERPAILSCGMPSATEKLTDCNTMSYVKLFLMLVTSIALRMAIFHCVVFPPWNSWAYSFN